ncbi:PREDICTED: TATA box-binding protein-associated factor RNA polymerase I subunit B [Diuraphis noxia]|uniref:TATA box-binding protein-associated factor RNA polymerase I subunit B n=1 Tax=Diuraphis noxia TaxID=143948 RepID=UPI00076379E5|nr:PREDICTED: TATA box-binding protein-associated factor RNA polymerase I subunit B [Diuraphis noxia]
MQRNECFVCGCNDFTVIDGAFVCNECGIQSQSIREEHINFHEDVNQNYEDPTHLDHEITTGSQLEKPKKLLSWECYNYILLGLTNELIELGAKPSLKIIVLQLWVQYLQCNEVAFTSKKLRKLPKLNTSIIDMDGEILYGVKNVKNKILHAKIGLVQGSKKRRCSNKRKSLTSSINSNMTSVNKQNRFSRKLKKLDHSARDSNNDSVGLSDNISLLQRSNKSNKIKVKFKKNIKKSLTSMPSKTKDLSTEETLKLFKSGNKYWTSLKKKEKKNVLSIKKLLSILQLALMINGDDIHLSDILRWIHEGHLHINRVNLFLPANSKHGIKFSKMIPSSRSMLNEEFHMILKHLKVDQLPNIDFKKLVIRFSDELQLPNDFTHFVCKLVSISPPSVKCNQILPDIEVKLMAYILFAAKFLFCLDGNSENLSSDFAEKINQSDIVDKKLFSWNDYVQYIEFRNIIVSKYSYYLHENMYGNNIRNTQLFINDWNIMKPTIPVLESDKICKNFRDNTECLLKSLPDFGRKDNYREIPASIKPLSSTLKWIIEYHSMELSNKAKTTLEKNFSQTDILYLTDEKRIYDLADECGVPIEVNFKSPLHYEKEKGKDPETALTPLYTSQSKVYLVNQEVYKKKQNETTNSPYEEKPNTIFLGTGSNYWHIHINKTFLKQAEISKINNVFKTKLPYSFLWLMNQCSRILDCRMPELYLELMNLEIKFFKLIQPYEKSNETKCETMFSNITL